MRRRRTPRCRRPRAGAHAARGAAVSRAAAGSRSRTFWRSACPTRSPTSLSGIGSLVVRSSATAARFAGGHAGPEGARRRSRRGSRGHGHAAARGRSVAGRGAARRCAERHAPHLAHRAVVARRPVPPAGRDRPARGRGAGAAAEPGAASPVSRRAARRPRLRALSPRERAGPHLRRAAARARSVRAVPRARSRDSHRRGRISAAATGSSASTSTERPTAKRAPRRPCAGRSTINPAPVRRAQVLRESRSGHRPGDAARSCACWARPTRHGNDPELFAGLVHACRYCGLLDESIAAHAEARRLDPERADEPRADAADDRRGRAAARRSSRRRSSPAPTMASASSGSGWRDVATTRVNAARDDAPPLEDSDVSFSGRTASPRGWSIDASRCWASR